MLVINTIKNGTTSGTEYIELIASERLELGEYALFDATFSNDGLSNKHRHLFTFPNGTLERGDRVRLHTGQGIPSLGENRTLVHLYWNMNQPIWNNNGLERAVVIKYQTVNNKKVV